MDAIDNIRLNFNPESLLLLNVILGIVMFGIALDLKLADFKLIFDLPKSIIVGLFGQFLLLPAVTYLLVTIIKPAPGIALGMMLVAACPGGNISNFLTYLAKGNTALSVCMSAVSTATSVVMTPLNFAFWGSLYVPARNLLTEISLNPLDMAFSIFLLLGLPMALGLYISHQYPDFADRAKTPMKYFSIIVFGCFVLGALAANFENFINYVGLVVFAVFIHNLLALFIGYTGARVMQLPEFDRRAVSIEVGIQNSGLGLLIIFNFFDGMGGMAIIAAWWGVWHIISGFSLVMFWARKTPAGMAAGNI